VSRFLCPTLVGRNDEVDVVDARLAEARAGRGGAVVLVGEAGSGKSRLVRESVRRAQKHGMRVLVGRAVDSPTPMAYRPLAEALAPLLRETLPAVGHGVAAPYRVALGRIVPEWRQHSDGVVDSPLLVGEGLLQLLRALNGAAALLVVLEDLHWADPETIDAVEYLADNLADASVVCVATTRPGAHGAVPERLGALVMRGSATMVEARPLPHQDVVRMAALSLGVGELPAGLNDLLLLTDGLPLLVEEVLAAASDGGALRRVDDGWVFAAGSSPPIPVTVRGAVARRLGMLAATERAVLGAAALLGRRFDVHLIGPIAQVGQDGVMGALRHGADLQLLVLEAGDVRFRHALTRDAVLDQMLRPERAALARTALTVIRTAHPDLPAEWCELAAVLQEEAGEPAAAAAMLLVAGRREHARGALRTAADMLERARGLAAPPTVTEIDRALLRVLAEAGRVDDAHDVGQRLLGLLPAQAPPGSPRVEVYLLLARVAVTAGRWLLARTQIARARSEASGPVAHIDALAAQVELGCGEPDDAVGLAERALALVIETEFAVRCEALEVLGRVARLRDLDRAREIFTRQLTAAEDGSLAVWRLRALHQLGTLDLLAGPVLDRMRQTRAIAVEQGALATTANIDLQIASNLGSGFRVDECLEAAQRCADLARRWRLGSMLPIAQVIAASAHGLAGRRPVMERLLAEVLAGDVDDEVRSIIRGRCRGILALLDEDHTAALRELDAAMDLVRPLPSPALRPWFALWALMRTVHERDGAPARAEARRLTPVGARPVEALLDFAEAVAAGRDGDPITATELASAADAALVPVADCIAGYHQLARRLVAEAAIDDGWGEPIRWMTDAVVFFHDHGHHPVARACRRLLRRAGAPVPRMGATTQVVPAALRRFGITEREHDVLRLVAAGRTSGQIADELVISRRTVDKHVERLMAKTGARRRSELTGLLEDPRT
jgi:DNA-binding CsgD family transcriptional regulator